MCCCRTVGWCSFFWVHKTAYPSWGCLCQIPEMLSVPLCFARDAPPLSAGMDPSGTHRIRPDFSPSHWKAGSRLFSCCKCEHRPPPSKGNKRGQYKHAWAGWTLRASCEGWGSLLHLPPAGMGQAGMGYQEVLGFSLHSAWAAAAPSHIPNALLVMAVTAELPAQLPCPWQRWRRQRDVGSFPPTDEPLLTLALSTPGLGLATANLVF